MSADSSHPINALFPAEPLSINIPQSFALLTAPVFNSIILSAKTEFVVLIVVVVPFTVKLPVIVALLVISTPPAPCKVRAPDDVEKLEAAPASKLNAPAASMFNALPASDVVVLSAEPNVKLPVP